jgi:DNA-binding transcriptional ArsR family regulator
VRIQFTGHDLARTRLRSVLDPWSETAFALRLLERPAGAGHHRLRRLLARQQQVVDEGTAQMSPSEGGVPDAVRHLWHSAIRRNWARISAHLRAEADWRARLATRDGIEQLLVTLHPQIGWDGSALSITDADGPDVRLEGRGLVLAPSMFLAHQPAVMVRRNPAEPGVLHFAAPPADAEVDRLFEPNLQDGPQGLGALVGQTRADVLRELVNPCTTGELADRVGVTSAGISQHTAVLRRAGLIITRRFRNRVLHSATPLGLALLGREAVSETTGQRWLTSATRNGRPGARTAVAPGRRTG